MLRREKTVIAVSGPINDFDEKNKSENIFIDILETECANLARLMQALVVFSDLLRIMQP